MSVEVGGSKRSVTAAGRAGPVERSDALLRIVRDVRLMLVALWLGGAVFFSAAVAPIAFSVLRARNVIYANEAAGTIVTRALSIINTGGFIIALVLLASAFLFREGATRRAFFAETISLAVVAVATGVGQWVIAARMVALRAAMVRPIDDVPVDDPLKVSFNSLHGYSVAALGVAIIAAAVALLVIARRGQRLEARG
ncbi:MAG: DUF4149 domain-containing protein [Acidobacteriota bacterium]|nr:DUF4149 domain-containing protein [Acidobacteriota bacterium]